MTESNGAASLETKDQIREDAEFVRTWLDAIELSSKEEEKWRKRAEEATNIYRSGSKNNSEDRSRTFNILFANVDTTVPSIYNSTPVPDVRRRYNDEDKVGKQVSDIIERAISYSVDAYDFDAVMKDCAKDTEIAGRATARVRYVPYFDEAGEAVVSEETNCEHVQWKDFRRGPGKTWDDVSWISFRHYLNRAQLRKLNKVVGNTVDLDSQVEGLQDKGDGKNESEIFKRATVWEIWDKDSREVIFIAESYKEKPLVRESDPLGLTAFYPVPRPIYAIKTSDSLCPVVPYDTYRDQAEELEHVSRRIMALVEALKAKGIYDGRMEEVVTLATADDNEMIPVASAANYLDGAGLEKAIAWWPIETIARVLKELYIQREQIKQTIYEITGLSDILRGQSDPNETLGAQELKKQTGSLRIQAKQADIQRFARDIFRLKAEIIATKFSWETISMMTGINFPSEQEKQAAQTQVQQMQQQAQAAGQQPQIPPQVQDMLSQPSREEVQKILKDDTTRAYRIDVESDSTIRADMTRNQNNMNMFLQGTAQYAAAMGPIVQLDKSLMPTVIEVYSAFARTYKLGKQAEDALDKLSDQGKQMAENPQPEKPDPAVELEKVKLDALKGKTAMEGEAKQRENAMKMQLMDKEMQIKEQEMALKERELQMKEREMQMNLAAKEREDAINAQAMTRKAALDERTAALQAESTEHKHGLGIEMMDHKAAQAKKAKPANGARK
jgi:hypothetical protein